MSTDYVFPQHLVRGLGACAKPPHFTVAPRAQDEGQEDHSEPILTVSGVGKEPCCTSCAKGGACEGGCPAQKGVGAACCASCARGAPCSKPKAPISVPGSTSFPVGFGQSPPITTTSVPVAVVSSWAFPIAIGLVSAAAGFGLAYAIKRKQG